jgi:hypothetical protein
MSRFGLEYNPNGMDRSRFESQEDFAQRLQTDQTAHDRAEQDRMLKAEWSAMTAPERDYLEADLATREERCN